MNGVICPFIDVIVLMIVCLNFKVKRKDFNHLTFKVLIQRKDIVYPPNGGYTDGVGNYVRLHWTRFFLLDNFPQSSSGEDLTIYISCHKSLSSVNCNC